MRAALQSHAQQRRNGAGRLVLLYCRLHDVNARQHMTDEPLAWPACPFAPSTSRPATSARTLPFPACCAVRLILSLRFPGSLVFSLFRFAQLRRSSRTPGALLMAVGRCEPGTRAVGDTALVTTGSTAPAAGQAAIITTPRLLVGEGDDAVAGLIEHRAAATQPPSPPKVHALERLTEGVRRARTRPSELAAEEGFALQGSQ